MSDNESGRRMAKPEPPIEGTQMYIARNAFRKFLHRYSIAIDTTLSHQKRDIVSRLVRVMMIALEQSFLRPSHCRKKLRRFRSSC